MTLHPMHSPMSPPICEKNILEFLDTIYGSPYLRQVVHSCHPSLPVGYGSISILHILPYLLHSPCVFKDCGLFKVEGGECNVVFVGIIRVLSICSHYSCLVLKVVKL